VGAEVGLEAQFRQDLANTPEPSRKFDPLTGDVLAEFKLGRVPEAEAALRRAIQIRPGGYAYHFALGVVLKTRGDLADALDQFRMELVNNPQQPAARQQIEEIEARLRKQPCQKRD